MNRFNLFPSFSSFWQSLVNNYLVRYFNKIYIWLVTVQVIIVFHVYSILNKLIQNIELKGTIFLSLDITVLILWLLTLVLDFIYYRYCHRHPQSPKKVKQQYLNLSKESIQFIQKYKLDFFVSWLVYWQTLQKDLRKMVVESQKVSRLFPQMIDEQTSAPLLNIVQKCWQKINHYKLGAILFFLMGFFYATFLYFSFLFFYIILTFVFCFITFLPLFLTQKQKLKCLRWYKRPFFQVIIPFLFLCLLASGLMTVNFSQQKSVFYFFCNLTSVSLPIHFISQQFLNFWRALRGNQAENLVASYLENHRYSYRRNINIITQKGRKRGDVDFSVYYRQFPYLLDVKDFKGTIFIEEEDIEGIRQPMLRRRYRTVRKGKRRNRNRNNEPFPNHSRTSCPAQKFLGDARWFQHQYSLLQEPICIFVFTHENVVLDLPLQYQDGPGFRFKEVRLVCFDQLDALLKYLSAKKL